MTLGVISYAIRSHDLVLDNEERNYILRIRDLPQNEKPREKMLEHGVAALSSSELLAVVLNTGTTKEGVLGMASRVMQEYGERALVTQNDPKKLSEGLDIPLNKAIQIVACAELGRRFFKKSANGVPVIRTAKEVYEYTKDMHELPKEHLRGIYLNAHYAVIHDEVISIGTVNANIIHPREVFRPALQYAAVALILVHNHPSGRMEASEADVEVTKQLVTAGKMLGIDLLDHVIVSREGYTSVKVDYRT